jgi:exonuclease III
MRVVWWNIENALPHLAELQQVVEQLGAPEVLCLQELRIRRQDTASVNARVRHRRAALNIPSVCKLTVMSAAVICHA